MRTPEAAVEEAEYCLEILDGRELDYPVAYDMEREGIRIDGQALREYGKRLSISIAELEKRIYKSVVGVFVFISDKFADFELFNAFCRFAAIGRTGRIFGIFDHSHVFIA